MEQVGDIYGFPVVSDDTLPPDHMKLVGGGRATVFRINNETGRAEVVSQWEEEWRE